MIAARRILVFLGILLTVPCFSQPGGPGGPPCWPPPCAVPINGGIVFLLAAGAVYGFYMLYRMRKRNTADATGR
ncbi:MAG: hypothetical protein HKL88_08330 [Bacteroidia bacterium]|nr:hypothetical protein [Bacteroidia bacterium]